MALTLGGFTAISANAQSGTVSSSTTSANAALNAATSTVLTVSGGNGEDAVLVIAKTGTAVGSWSLTAGMKLSGATGSGTTATAAMTTLVKTTGSTGSVVLTVTPTAGAGTITVSDDNGPLLVITINGSSVSTNDNPWLAEVDGVVDTIASGATPSAFTVNNVITSATDYTAIVAGIDTAAKDGLGSFRYVEVSGSTIQAIANPNSPMTLNGLVNVATQVSIPLDGNIFGLVGNRIHVNTSTAGTVTVKFYDRVQDTDTLFTTVTLLQTITIVTKAPGALDASKSTSVINANSLQLAAFKAASSHGGHLFDGFVKDETIVAAKAVNGASMTTDAVAVIKVVLKDSTNSPLLNSPSLPKIGARVEGASPGTIAIAYAAAGASLTSTAGRNVSVAAPVFVEPGTFYVNIFSDGNGGKSTISILVNDAVWKTETLSFYGAATAVKATQNRYVLQDGSTAGSSYGCTAGLGCTADDVATSVAVSLAATDADGIAVPYLTYKAASSDAAVLTGNSTATTGVAAADFAGVTHFQATVPYGALAGKSATLTYTTGTVVSNPLTFALGGAAATVSISLSGNTEVGALNEITVEAKDAAGNKAYDKDHTAFLTSNVVVNTAVNSDQKIFDPLLGDTVSVWDGKGTVKFFNPIVPTTLIIGGKVGGASVSATAAISNSTLNAAADAAAEATDAANAATDAANAAAEAADAATAAAQDAVDAVAALSVQVTAMISALKKQLIALTNLVIKIQKKVKA